MPHDTDKSLNNLNSTADKLDAALESAERALGVEPDAATEALDSLAVEPVRPIDPSGALPAVEAMSPTQPVSTVWSSQSTESFTAATEPVATTPAPEQSTSSFVPGAPVPPTGTSARGAARNRKNKKAAAAQAATTAPKAKKSGGGFKTFALGFLGAALAFGLGWGITGGLNRMATPTLIEGAEDVSSAEAVNQAENLAEAVAEKTLPSIAAIDTYVSQKNYGGFWGYGPQDNSSSGSLMAYGLGSGVVITTDGYILTNYHVVEGADKVMVTVGGQEYEGTVAGTDPSSDLAVIKINPEGELPAIEIGDSSALKPGQWVMSLGSPFGLEQSVATGIISAISRTVVMGSSDYSYGGQSEVTNVYANMIQTDAAINPGNSGGALVDQNGHLIGINSVIESYSGSYSGVGFAIPVNYAMNIAQQIIDGKTPTHAQIGVATTSVDASIAERYGLSVNQGAYVSKVYANSGAEEAGLQPGDIITKVDNTKIESSTDLVAAARAHTPGEQIEVTYVRGSETKTATVTLGSDENTELATGTMSSQNDGQQYNPYGGYGQGDNGMSMEDLLEYFGYGYGGSDMPDNNGPDSNGSTDGNSSNNNSGNNNSGNNNSGGYGNDMSMEELLEYFGYGSGNGQGQGQQQDAA